MAAGCCSDVTNTVLSQMISDVELYESSSVVLCDICTAEQLRIHNFRSSRGPLLPAHRESRLRKMSLHFHGRQLPPGFSCDILPLTPEHADVALQKRRRADRAAEVWRSIVLQLIGHQIVIWPSKYQLPLHDWLPRRISLG